MQFDIVTIFPEFFAGPLDYGIVRRAREARLMDVRVHDLRAFAHDRHRTVDDRPFGGGEGMVLKPEPLFEAVEWLLNDGGVDAGLRGAVPSQNKPTHANDPGSIARQIRPPSEDNVVVLLSASGKLFRQDTARRFAQLERIILICGRYEGVDERVAEHLATDELSIGDYVLSGGELGASLIVDAVTRLLPGALGNEDSTVNESFSAAQASGGDLAAPAVYQPPFANHLLLDCPHYTRPAEFRGWPVPEVLLSGNHEEIRSWRTQKALEKTQRNRPDLLPREASLL